MFLVLVGQFATYTYVTPFLAQVSGFSGTTISSLLLGYTAIGLIGNFVGGAGAGRNIRNAFLATIVFLMLPLLLMPAFGASKGLTILLLAVWGLAYGAMPVVLQIWMVKAAPKMAEGGMALFISNFQISIAAGSLLGGVVVDAFGLFNAMYLGGLLAALSALTVLFFGRAKGRSSATAIA